MFSRVSLTSLVGLGYDLSPWWVGGWVLSKVSVNVNADDFPATGAGMNVSGRLSVRARLEFVSFVLCRSVGPPWTAAPS